ncbi:MAG: hypothetical protein OXH84_05395 [Gammaproteobacteria bacterium]|nr:hypothetical protein [Gammaproteobacteria bacterium]
MRKLLRQISTTSQALVVSIALAMLIVPYSNAQEEEYGDPLPAEGDLDQDRIENEIDVCIYTSYGIDEHVSCLSQAGVVVIGTNVISLDSLKKRYEAIKRGDSPEDGAETVEEAAQEMMSWLAHKLFQAIGVPPVNWKDLNIKTCDCLKAYSKDLEKFSEKMYRWANRISFSIPFIDKFDPTSEIRATIGIVLAEISIMYSNASSSATSAHGLLCDKDRLAKREKRKVQFAN